MELFFDMAATTPVLPEVQDAVVAAFLEYGNPSSLHRKGMDAERMIQEAEKGLRASLGRSDGRIVFTGSGTEANNLAILGAARRFQSRGKHLVTTAIEHPSVREPFQALERDGFEVTYVRPEPDGGVLAESVLASLREDTILVSMMHVNNETGALLPVDVVGRALSSRRKTLFHVDGVQAFGKIRDSAAVARADLYTASAHKIGGPKGVGALYLKSGIDVDPIVYGGGQQYGLRSGTENVPAIAGFGVASRLAAQSIDASYRHVEGLSELLINGLMSFDGCFVERPHAASPYIVMVRFANLRGEVLVHAFESKGLYVSTGSACSSKDQRHKGSEVLLAMGLQRKECEGAIRLSLSRFHTEDDVRVALSIIREQTDWVRSLL